MWLGLGAGTGTAPPRPRAAPAAPARGSAPPGAGVAWGPWGQCPGERLPLPGEQGAHGLWWGTPLAAAVSSLHLRSTSPAFQGWISETPSFRIALPALAVLCCVLLPLDPWLSPQIALVSRRPSKVNFPWAIYPCPSCPCLRACPAGSSRPVTQQGMFPPLHGASPAGTGLLLLQSIPLTTYLLLTPAQASARETIAWWQRGVAGTTGMFRARPCHPIAAAGPFSPWPVCR